VLEIEVQVFKAVLDVPSRWETLAEMSVDEFTSNGQAVWTAMRSLVDRGDSINHISLRGQLERTQTMLAAGGIELIASFADLDRFPSEEDFETWVRDLKKAAKASRIHQEVMRWDGLCLAKEKDPDAILDEIRAFGSDFNISSSNTGSFGPMELANLASRYTDRVISSEDGVTGISSGITGLDDLTAGFQPGSYVAIGARPSVGKSSIALQFARHAANQGLPVGFFSLEMSAEQLGFILAASDAKVSRFELQHSRGKFNRIDDMQAAIGRLSKLPFYVEKLDRHPNIGAVTARARRLKHRHGIKFLVLDYIQLLGDSEKNKTRNDELTKISAGLKSLAMELEVPILVLAQLNREAAKESAVPMLNHFRDTGGLESDSDVAILLHRPNEERLPMEDVTLYVRKNRFGPCGQIQTTFNASIQTFEEKQKLSGLRLV
jgi:replicative DNA helicase